MDTLEPIEDVIARIERRLEHEYGQCTNDCLHCARIACSDCDKTDIMVLGQATPLRTYIDPCPAHTDV